MSAGRVKNQRAAKAIATKGESTITEISQQQSSPTLLIVGCGDLGQRVGAAFAEKGWHIHAVRRHPPAGDGRFHWHAADYTVRGSLDFAARMRPDFVLACFNPVGRDVPGYRRGFSDAAMNLLAGLGGHRARRLLMISSTRVYAERGGGWVDENAPLSTEDERALAIIAAERQFQEAPHPCSIVRFGGIYGSANSRLVSRIAQGNVAPAVPVRYTNRMHREDCAGFLGHLLALAQAGEELAAVYNGVDDEPAPAHEVESWIARALGGDVAPAPAATAAASPNHKRCRNGMLHASGYQLRYPHYRAGYRELLSRFERP